MTLACNFTTVGLYHRCFPVKFLKVFRKAFLQDTYRRLLLEVLNKNILKSNCSEKLPDMIFRAQGMFLE